MLTDQTGLRSGEKYLKVKEYCTVVANTELYSEGMFIVSDWS